MPPQWAPTIPAMAPSLLICQLGAAVYLPNSAKGNAQTLLTFASHIKRGSKLNAASMVVTTTEQKNTIPIRGSAVPSVLNCSSDEVSATTTTSSIDQYPMNSTTRKSFARSLLADTWPCRTDHSNNPSARNFTTGTATLAMKIKAAMSQDPARQKLTTPPSIVLSSPPRMPLVCITGKMFAGIYKSMPASSHARVLSSLRGRRARILHAQRVQRASLADEGRGNTRPQVPHKTSPSAAAVNCRLIRVCAAQAPTMPAGHSGSTAPIEWSDRQAPKSPHLVLHAPSSRV